MRELKLSIAVLVAFACFERTRTGFLDFRPLSVRREKSLNNPGGPEKLPVLDFIGLVGRHGYPAEEHLLHTEDGYRLRVHRISGSPRQPSGADTGKPVVYIQHGIFASSDAFVLAGPDRDLAYILADAGYDVWLGNFRGNTYSRSHTHLSPDRNPDFWKFSQHEIGLYDLSSTIDYILGASGQPSLVYVGHSMGTTVSFILLSCRPVYNEKISLVVNLATIGNWKRPRNLMRFLRNNGEFVKTVLQSAGITELLPQTLAGGEILNGTCRDGSALQRLCANLIQYVSGYDPDMLDTKLLAESFAYFPAGASSQTLIHYHQNMVAGKMQMYDYGMIGNFAHYRRFTPPTYNLENVMTRVVMIYGKGDAVAAPEDSLDLLNVLKNARAESVPHDNFSHLDFVWAKDIKRVLQNRIMEIVGRSYRYGNIGEL